MCCQSRLPLKQYSLADYLHDLPQKGMLFASESPASSVPVCYCMIVFIGHSQGKISDLLNCKHFRQGVFRVNMSPTFLAPATGLQDSFSMTCEGYGMIQARCIYCALYLAFLIITLALLRSSGIRSWRVGSPGLGEVSQ